MGRFGPIAEEACEAFPEENFKNLCFRVLPDLQSPQRDDARRWADLVETLKPGRLSKKERWSLERTARGLFGEQPGACL